MQSRREEKCSGPATLWSSEVSRIVETHVNFLSLVTKFHLSMKRGVGSLIDSSR